MNVNIYVLQHHKNTFVFHSNRILYLKQVFYSYYAGLCDITLLLIGAVH